MLSVRLMIVVRMLLMKVVVSMVELDCRVVRFLMVKSVVRKVSVGSYCDFGSG